MSKIITVENLGKKYILTHQNREPYIALRDVIAEKARQLGRKMMHPFMMGGDRTVIDPSHEEFWALQGISFGINQGDRVGIIGRNGAGKSTLLKILSMITKPTKGRVEINGRVASLLEVGTGFSPELTGKENIFLNGAILGMKKAEIKQKFDEIVAFAEVEKFLDTPVKHYSSGMYMRLAFAVAAHLEPEILVIDEVLAVGDAQFQKKCLGKMEDISSHDGRTILFVSHSMQAVSNLCSKAIWLVNGTLQGFLPTSEAVSLYLSDLQKLTDFDSDLSTQIAALPLDPSFLLTNIALSQNGSNASRFANGLPIEIAIKYKILQRVTGFHVYFQVCERDGTVIFESLSDGQLGEIISTEPGEYLAKALIPLDLLNAGDYELHILAAIHNVRRCTPTPIILKFNIDATGRVNCTYPAYKSPGKIAPFIEWTTLKC